MTMIQWMTNNRGRVLACFGALVGATLLLAGCSTVKGVGEDISGASDSVRTAVFGNDADSPPLD
jgi:predicted small secreted protein